MSRQPGCKELKAFPGPLVPGKTDKLDVIRYVFYCMHNFTAILVLFIVLQLLQQWHY